MNQLKSRTIFGPYRFPNHHQATCACIHRHARRRHTTQLYTLIKSFHFMLSFRQTLSAAHLAFISLIFDECLYCSCRSPHRVTGLQKSVSLPINQLDEVIWLSIVINTAVETGLCAFAEDKTTYSILRETSFPLSPRLSFISAALQSPLPHFCPFLFKFHLSGLSDFCQ